jgi:hypothetical protein
LLARADHPYRSGTVQRLARRRLVHAALGVALLSAVLWIYRGLADAALNN